MTVKPFNVKGGLTTGNIFLDASTGNANVANVNVTDTVTTANISVALLKSNLIPNGNGVLSLANATNRYKDFYLSANLDINGQTITANADGITAGNVFFTNANIDSVAINNQLVINSTTESTSTITGTIVTNGGVGIQKDLTVGGNINLAPQGSSTPKGAINYNNIAESIDFKFN
jgi:hypothetical protein